jgi:hypothetical protein
MKPYLNIDYYIKNELIGISLLEDIRVILNETTVGPIIKYFKDYSIQQTKIFDNKYSIELLKNTNILCINSGDFDLTFNIEI